MNYEEIKKLMDDMGNSKLSEIEIEFPDGIKISMKKDDGLKLSSPVPMVQEVNSPAVKEPADLAVVEDKIEGHIVKAPMVGTFYSKSSKSSEPFVEVGSKVKKGDVLCIIEAMKLMNEIESEFDGEVVEVLVKDNEMVDYGKPLFVIK